MEHRDTVTNRLDLADFENVLSLSNYPLALDSLLLRSRQRIVSERGKGVSGDIADLDKACRIFSERLACEVPPEKNLIGFDRPTNIYIISEIYQTGGHRILLEQLIKTRPDDRHVVLFTAAFDNNRDFSLRKVSKIGALALAPDASLTAYEKLLWLRNKLAAFAATRLFLLHHPEDALAAIATYEIEARFGRKLYFVRHADTVPSLGSSLAGATHLAIRREQMTEISRSTPDASVILLPLSFDPDSIDPPIDDELLEYAGDIDRGFFNSSHFLTATCGGSHKFLPKGDLGLPNLLCGILRNPFRRHVHIGPLSTELRSAIFTALDDAGIPAARLKLLGEVRSVAETLAAEKVDLFIASVPVGGGLTIAEAAFIGLPIAIHQSNGTPLDKYLSGITHAPDKILAWKTSADLAEKLNQVDEDQLTELSAASRKWFREKLSASRFASCFLDAISKTEGSSQNGNSVAMKERAHAAFDPQFYIEHYADVREAKIDPRMHFSDYGQKEGRQPSILFMAAHYLAQLPSHEMELARDNPFGHYLTRGEQLGYSPHPLFCPQLCLLSFKQLGIERQADLSILEQYLRVLQPVKPHTFFDPQFYERQLPLSGLLTEPHLVHFLKTGGDAGLSPHPLIDMSVIGGVKNLFSYMGGGEIEAESPHILFDVSHFQKKTGRYTCVAAPNVLWEHVIEGNVGTHEPHPLVSPKFVEQRRQGMLASSETIIERLAKNKLGVDTHPLVASSHIVAQAPWAKSSAMSVTEYFLRYGSSQRLNPHPFFLTGYYLNTYPDVEQAGRNPLVHYLSNGDQEGRIPSPFFNTTFYRESCVGPNCKTSSLVSYVEKGTAHFLGTQPQDGVFVNLSKKAAKRVFEAGATSAAEDYLKETLHSEWAAAHPTLVTEAMDFVTDCARLKAASDKRTVFDSEVVTVNRPAIVAGKPISAPAGTYVAPVAQTAVYSNATIIGGGDGFVTEGLWYDPGLIGFDPDTMLTKHASAVFAVSGDKALIRRYETSDFFESGILGCGSYAPNYFHFLFEVLPRAMLAAETAPARTPIFVDADMPIQHYQAIMLFLPHNPLIRLNRNQSFQVGKLYAASMPSLVHDAFGKAVPPTDSVRYHPEVLKRLAKIATGVKAGKPNKLFLRREGSIRKLLNLNDIQERLVDRGFEVVSCERLDFLSQVQLFANADTIVGPTGAHLANIVFAPPGCKIFPLYSDAPGTNFYLWSGLADLMGQRLINIAGSRVMGSVAALGVPEAHEDYWVDPTSVTAFFNGNEVNQDTTSRSSDKVVDVVPVVEGLLDVLLEANAKAAVLGASWNVLADNTVPNNFYRDATEARDKALLEIAKLDDDQLQLIIRHRIYSDLFANLRSGMVLRKNGSVGKGHKDAFSRWSGKSAVSDLDRTERMRYLMGAALCFQPWELALLNDLNDLPEGEAQDYYLKWITSRPFLVTEADEESYKQFAVKLLLWFDRHLVNDRSLIQLSMLRNAIQQLDLGKLLLIDKPLSEVEAARNKILEKLALRSQPVRVAPRPLNGSQGRRRVGIIFRTFAKGPDSEAVVAFLKAFDHSSWEIFGYSMGHVDRVAQFDPEFDNALRQTFSACRVLDNDAQSIRETILRDDLDVFLFANATAYGITAFDLALYHRVAPLQVILNSHLPMPMGYPSFDALLTGESDHQKHEIVDKDYREKVVRVAGPVINYLSSLEPKPDSNLTRARLGIGEDDVVMFCAGSLSKMSWSFLKTAMSAAKGSRDAKLLLAPYNPGWAGVNLAIPFMQQIEACAVEVGFDLAQMRIMGELSVAEAEAAVRLADVYLAPFPHGGATMLHLALINGVPPIVLRRNSPRSIDQFLMAAVGLTDLLTNTPAEYVELARKIARDNKFRTDASRRIRDIDRSVLINNENYSRQMERALITMIIEKETNLSNEQIQG